MNGIGKPIRLTVEISPGRATNQFDRTLRELSGSFDRVSKGATTMGKSLSDAFDAGRRSVKQFADAIDQLNTRLGLTDSRIASRSTISIGTATTARNASM